MKPPLDFSQPEPDESYYGWRPFLALGKDMLMVISSSLEGGNEDFVLAVCCP